MRFCLYFFICLSLIATSSTSVVGQSKKDTVERGRVFTVSGIGLGITGGKTADIITPKVSTKIGIDASVGTKGFFLYPSVNFLVFKYSQKEEDPDYTYSISLGGRTAMTSLSVPIGYRRSINRFNISAFAGPGLTQIVEPRLEVNTQTREVKQTTHNKYTASVAAGVGVEYLLGQFALFAELSHLYNDRQFQNRKTYIFPVFVGFKSNISNVFTRKTDN